jgi:hypothetical protein
MVIVDQQTVQPHMSSFISKERANDEFARTTYILKHCVVVEEIEVHWVNLFRFREYLNRFTVAPSNHLPLAMALQSSGSSDVNWSHLSAAG